MNETTAIRVEGLSKCYRIGAPVLSTETFREMLVRRARSFGRRDSASKPSVWALKDVTFEVPAGTSVGIIGANGAGKSTLLKILSRITEPSAGRAEIRGRVGSLLEVGTGFHPELTGRENIFLNGAILGMGRNAIRGKFDEIVAFSETGEFIDTPIKRYSTGMYLRLAFAVAAHLDLEVLLVDEVLAVGDIAFQRKCLSKMGSANGQGKTVIFVSHQMNQIHRLCANSLWIDCGRLRLYGPTAKVVAAYEASTSSPPEQKDSTRPVRFTGWEIVGSQDKHEVRTTQPVRIRFHLQVTEPIRNGHHGIGLYDLDGRLLWGTGTDGLKLETGDYQIDYMLPLPLRPGAYRWHVTILENMSPIEDWNALPAMTLSVSPMGHSRDECAGFLNFPYELSITDAQGTERRVERREEIG